MTWQALSPYQTRAQMPVYVPGRGPVAKRSKLVYRGRAAYRHADGEWASADSWEFCGHNHLKKTAAERCTARLVRWLDKEGMSA